MVCNGLIGQPRVRQQENAHASHRLLGRFACALQGFQGLLLGRTQLNCIVGHQHTHLTGVNIAHSIPLMNLRDTVLGKLPLHAPVSPKGVYKRIDTLKL